MKLLDTEPALGGLSPDAPAKLWGSESFQVNEDLLARVVRTSPFGIVLSSLEDGLILDVNEGFSRLTGYSREEAIGQSSAALGLWVDPARRAVVVETLREHRQLRDIEALIRTKSGDTRHFIASMEAVDVDGLECAIFQFSDLTSQRQAEVARSAAEAQFQALVEQIPAIIYTESLGDGDAYTYISPQVEALFGCTPADIVGKPGVTIARIHPDDRERVQLEGKKTTATGEPFQMEYRLRARDGRWVRVRDEAVLVRDADGQPLHWQGFLVDVTDQRRAEEDLRESEARLRAIVTSAPMGILMYDASGEVVLANQVAERLLGLPESQLLGRSPRDPRWSAIREDGSPLPGEDHPAIVALRTGQPCEGIIMGVRGRDDELTWLSVNSQPLVRDGETAPYAGISTFVDLTRRRFLETELRRSEERFRSLVQNSYDVITVVSPDGARRYVSPSIETLLGYSSAQLLAGSALDLVHPDDAPRLQDAIDALARGAKRTPTFELRFHHRDGDWRDFETVGTNMLDETGVNGIVFNSREITARKATEEALRESEQRFRSAFDHAPIGLALVSPDGRFRQVNRSLCDLVGYTECELLGKTFQEITHPDDLEDDLAQTERMWAGEISTYELEKRYLHKDGHAIWIHLTVSVVQQEDGTKYAIAQIEDISARRHLDLERATMLASEREYTRQLRELAEMRSNLTAMVAHELRSPVAALRLMTEMLATGEPAPAAEAETFASMLSQIDQMHRLVSDVASSAAAERDEFSVQFQPVSLAVLLDGAAAFARTTLSDHRFSESAAPDVQVWCDPERISQVLCNLLDNAAKHTPPGTPVALTAAVCGKRVRIQVANQGPAIPADELALIFEKFGRGRDAANRKTAGAGLGLYVSRRIVEAHGTDLSVESTPDRGTMFGFKLRIAT